MNPDSSQSSTGNAEKTVTAADELSNLKDVSELPVEGKWPRGWRLVFIFGSCLIFWVIVAFRWL